jgi:hypothetical protein
MAYETCDLLAGHQEVGPLKANSPWRKSAELTERLPAEQALGWKHTSLLAGSPVPNAEKFVEDLTL